MLVLLKRNESTQVDRKTWLHVLLIKKDQVLKTANFFRKQQLYSTLGVDSLKRRNIKGVTGHVFGL